jgi:DNA helicase-4
VTLREWLLFNAAAAAISLAILFAGRRQRKRGSKSDERYRQRLLTARGETVKSRGEKMIADYLHVHNIKYEYEKPANDSSNKRIISRPDFYLPEYDIYVEYWGMVNTEEPGKRREYVKGMEWKMARYRESGLKVISIYPKDLGNLDSIFRAALRK